MNALTKVPRTANVRIVNKLGTQITNIVFDHTFGPKNERHFFLSLFVNERTPMFEINYETGHKTDWDHWMVSFDASDYYWRSGKLRCYLTAEDAGKIVIVNIVPDGDEARMEVECPVSSPCTKYIDKLFKTNDKLYANWMTANFDKLSSKKLTQIALPGSHDAGMYNVITIQDCKGATACSTETQVLDMYHQLKIGVRYFDLRPTYHNNEFYAGHYATPHLGCDGDSIKNIVADVARFSSEHENELIILKFAHYYDIDAGKKGFDQKRIAELVALVKPYLNLYLVKSKTPLDLLSLSLGDIISKAQGQLSAVIALFDGVTTDWENGILRTWDINTFDKYTNTCFLNKMAKDQFKKLADNGGKANELFLLSWTLTQGAGCLALCVTILGRKANDALQAVADNHDNGGKLFNVLYTDMCDGRSTRICMDANGLPVTD